VRLEPAVAFGFGEHPTTRLAARAVERSCRRGGVRTVLDFGSGSGVLAIVAVVTGAAKAVGLDVDARAVDAAKRNAALNGVASRCSFSKGRLSRVRTRFDLVVANVDRGTLLDHASRLAHAVGPGGTLLTTGFLRDDVPDLVRAFTTHGLRRSAVAYDGDWALLTLSARAPRAQRVTRVTRRRTTRKPKNR
jgi:ribosomal protein L11 methyltransferase